MDANLWNTDVLLHIVKKILQYFEEWSSTTSSKEAKYSYIDVTLLKTDTIYYTIQITNYGQSTNNVLLFSYKIFGDLIITHTFPKSSLIATVYNQTEYSNCREVLDLYCVQNHLSLMTSKNDRNLINFLYQKKYVSLLLKNKLIFSDKEKFTNVILDEIISLKQSSSHIKFMFHMNQNMLHNNYIALDNDYKSCQVLARALTSVIKQSLNVRFKENCFSTLNVENSHVAESALLTKLIPLICKNYIFPNDN